MVSMQGVVGKLLVLIAVAAIGLAQAFASHRISLTQVSTSGAIAPADHLESGAVPFGTQTSGAPCHDHDEAADGATPDQTSAPHDCCAAFCHFMATIADLTGVVELDALSTSVPLSAEPVPQETVGRRLEGPPRIG